MKKLVLTSMIAILSAPSLAQAQEFTDAQKKEIEVMIRDYILNNGETVIQGVNNFQKAQEEETNKKSEESAKQLIESLKKDKNIASVGNPDGDVMVVEFFDYNCGYCKKAFAEVQTLLEDDKNVRVVLYDMPILGPTSTLASRWALAAKKQGKYWGFHQALMTHSGAVDEATLSEIAEKAGIDAEKLKKDAASKDIDAELSSHMQAAQSLGIQGTPGFLVNEQVFRGYIPYDQMKKAIADARKTASATKE